MQYFDQTGRRLRREEALDASGVLRDGMIARTSKHLRDSAPRFASLLVTDAGATNTQGNRPGYRVSDSPINANDRAAAYQQYNDELTNAWRTGAGVQEMRGSQEGDACTINGGPGRLMKEGGSLVCKPTAQDARGEPPQRDGKKKVNRYDPGGRSEGYWEEEDDDDDDNCARRTEDNARQTVDEMRAAHQQNMARVYAERDAELREAWRGK